MFFNVFNFFFEESISFFKVSICFFGVDDDSLVMNVIVFYIFYVFCLYISCWKVKFFDCVNCYLLERIKRFVS